MSIAYAIERPANPIDLKKLNNNVFVKKENEGESWV
jgi:hypothetical protein